MAVLTLTFLGSFQAAIDNQPITRFRSDKTRALLAYLAVEAERPHSRASLCGLLWPDQNDDAALHNLSQTLLRLREALGDTRGAAAFLRISRQAIQWNAASDYRLDTTEFARLGALSEQGEEQRLRSDRYWRWMFVLTFFAIHASRMNIEWNLVGLLSPALATVGDVLYSLLLAYLVVAPVWALWRWLTRPLERRAWRGYLARVDREQRGVGGAIMPLRSSPQPG